MIRDVPIEIRRGNNDPAVIWEFLKADGSPADLTGSIFALAVAWPGLPRGGFGDMTPAGQIEHSSDPAVDASASALIVDAAAGRVTWPYSLAESQQIPRGQGPRYELTRTISGKTRTWAGGPVTIRSFLP